jgi:hypothetical protein
VTAGKSGTRTVATASQKNPKVTAGKGGTGTVATASQKNPKMTDREKRNPEGGDGVQAVLAEMAAVIERAAADLSLAEEPSRFAAALEHEPQGGTRDVE